MNSGAKFNKISPTNGLNNDPSLKQIWDEATKRLGKHLTNSRGNI